MVVIIIFYVIGGEGGIRTHGRHKPSTVFKTVAINQTLPPLLWITEINYSTKM